MTLDGSPGGLASLYAEVGSRLSGGQSRAEVFDAVARIAVDRVSGTEWASITQGRNGRFTTVAATDDRARALDGIEYELRSGPCVDAVLKDVVFWTDELADDGRWPDFGRRAMQEYGVRSMLSYRLFVEDDQVIAALNLYSTRPGAFAREAHVVGTIVAAHGALAISTAVHRQQVDQLEQALATNRDIGTAMGILMAQHKVSRQQAFDLLRVASQNSNRKLVDLALDVVNTGTLPLPDSSRRAPSAPAGETPRTSR